jgi:methylated-DNA-[protein]-cysteine S-methyltransferase
MTTLRTTEIKTPLGALTLALKDQALCAAGFTDSWSRLLPRLERRFPGAALSSGPAPAELERAFAAYWAGELDALDALPVDLGGTPFQASVWAALRRIPAGATISYLELGRAIGSAGASRAVGAANGANPVSIVIPCHRVIRADGALCGYAWGVERKRSLLTHEGALGQAA